ncbi:MAG: glutamine synthetase, partial [Bacteroidales bacterium]|nr:glutamine synthetase [Bacteroidales bacterium]
MAKDANPLEVELKNDVPDKQTVEYRASDGSADIYTLFACLAVAARHGLEMKNALKYAEETYVDVDIFKDKNKAKNLHHLPASCAESADFLEKQKDILLQYDVFTKGILNGVIEYHRQFKDKNLRKEMENKPEEVMKLVEQYFHCG